jgi:hypothetical protein
MGIKQPPTYVHPNKRKTVTPEPVRRAPQQAPKKEWPQKEKEGTELGKQRRLSLQSADKTIRLRLVIYPPTNGQLPLYDQMIASGIEPKTALLGLLKRGFPAFEKKLTAGSIKAPTNDLDISGAPVDTTRNVSPQFIEAAKALFDPFEILSDRALGRKIAETILVQIEENEPDAKQH